MGVEGWRFGWGRGRELRQDGEGIASGVKDGVRFRVMGVLIGVLG